MRTENKPVHYCEHCGRHYLRANACKDHESKCFKNPANLRPCLNWCVYLEKKMAEGYSGYRNDFTGEPATGPVTVFHCAKKDVFMHLPKNSLKGNVIELVEHENEEMPVSCSDFKDPIDLI